MLADQFDTCLAQCVDNPGQGLDDAPNGADARFHPLDGWQRNTGEFGKRPLVNAQQGPSRPHLERRNHATFHVLDMINDVLSIYNDVKNIIWQERILAPKGIRRPA
jgi:hypothetical protein